MDKSSWELGYQQAVKDISDSLSLDGPDSSRLFAISEAAWRKHIQTPVEQALTLPFCPTCGGDTKKPSSQSGRAWCKHCEEYVRVKL